MTALIWYGLGALGLVVLAGIGLAEKISVASLIDHLGHGRDAGLPEPPIITGDQPAMAAQYATSITSPMPRVMRARQF